MVALINKQISTYIYTYIHTSRWAVHKLTGFVEYFQTQSYDLVASVFLWKEASRKIKRTLTTVGKASVLCPLSQCAASLGFEPHHKPRSCDCLCSLATVPEPLSLSLHWSAVLEGVPLLLGMKLIPPRITRLTSCLCSWALCS